MNTKVIFYVVEVQGHFKLPEIRLKTKDQYLNSLLGNFIFGLLVYFIWYKICFMFFCLSKNIQVNSQTLKTLQYCRYGGIFENFSYIVYDLWLDSCIQEFCDRWYQPGFNVTRGQYLKILQLGNLTVGIETSYIWWHWAQDTMLCLEIYLATKEWHVEEGVVTRPGHAWPVLWKIREWPQTNETINITGFYQNKALVLSNIEKETSICM